MSRLAPSAKKKLHKLVDNNRDIVDSYLFNGHVFGGKPLTALIEEYKNAGSYNPFLRALSSHLARCLDAVVFLEGAMVARAHALTDAEITRHDYIKDQQRKKREEHVASGIKKSGNRPKSAKHLRAGTEKKFKNDDPEAKKKYNEKLAARAARKRKK